MWVLACSSGWGNWRESDIREFLYRRGLLPACCYTGPSPGKCPHLHLVFFQPQPQVL